MAGSEAAYGIRLRTRLIRCVLVALVAVSMMILMPQGVRADDAAAAYKLGTGDKVRVTVFGEKDLSGDFDVNDQGLVALPLIGPTRLAGKTISEAESLITTALAKDYLLNPRVN